jgi:hypothetical protein
MGRDLTNLYISESFQYLAQLSGSQVTDGTGSLISSLDVNAATATTASFAVTASFALNAGGGAADTGSLLKTASIVDATTTYTKGDGTTFDLTVNNVVNADSASVATTADSATSASYSTTATSASHADNASTANSATSASYATNASTADSATSASYSATATSASHAQQADNADTATSASYSATATSASHAQQADNADTATSSSYSDTAVSASYATTADATPNALVTASITDDTIAFLKGGGGTFNLTVNNVVNADSASYVAGANVDGTVATATTASHALIADDLVSTANININSITASEASFTSASITNLTTITGSIVQIGDPFIILNTATPTQRYAGVKVEDSGSAPQNYTASLQFDSVTNDWFYEYSGSDPTDYGIAMFGPEYGTKGSPTYLSNNTIPKGDGGHHLNDSNITDSGTKVQIAVDTAVTGDLDVTADITAQVIEATTNFAGDLIGTASWADNATSASIANTSSYAATGSVSLQSYDLFQNRFFRFYNGSTFGFPSGSVVSNGVSASYTLQCQTGQDLYFAFSSGIVLVDVTPSASTVLTAGTDSSPQENYVYILNNGDGTGALTSSVAGYPSGVEYAPIARTLVQSVATVQSDGGSYLLQEEDTHVWEQNNTGHLSHINDWILSQPATWISGTSLSCSIDTGPNPDTVNISITSGKVLQLHEVNFPALNTATGDDIHVINDPTTPYLEITDLNQLTQDSTGTAFSGNDRFSVVIWGAANRSGTYHPIMLNLPSGVYNGDQAAIEDANAYTNYTIPTEWKGVGFLISRLTFNYSSGNLQLIDQEDLRGLLPSLSPGGGAGAQTSFGDTDVTIFNTTDNTKTAQFSAAAISTGTLRTFTFPDVNGKFVVSDANGDFTVTGSITAGDEYLIVSGSTTGSAISNLTDQGYTPPQVKNVVTLTQAEYNAISASADVNTLYFISDAVAGATLGSNTFEGNQTINGDLTITGSQLITGSLRGEVEALSIASLTASVDLSTGNFYTLALVDGSDTHVTATNILPGQTVNLRLTNGASGTGTVSFQDVFKFPSGSAYTGSAGASAVDIVSFASFDNTTLYANFIEKLV